MIHKEEPPNPEAKKLYSKMSINLATFFGGPIGGSFLLRQNFLALDNKGNADKSIIWGFVITVVFLTLAFYLPDSKTITGTFKILPFVFAGLISLITENQMGKEIKNHEETGGNFFSPWRATGIALLISVLMVIIIGGGAYLAMGDMDGEAYDQRVEQFQANEDKALEVYDLVDINPQKAILYIDDVCLKMCEANIALLDEMDSIAESSDEFIEQNLVIRQYTNLRIENFSLIRKALIEDTDIYDEEISMNHEEMDYLLGSLSE